MTDSRKNILLVDEQFVNDVHLEALNVKCLGGD